jgi:hypothetical protein
MSLTKQSKIGLSAGGAFTALVVGLLVTLFARKADAEQVAAWTVPPTVTVCEGGPAGALLDLPDVAARLKQNGLQIGSVDRGPCIPCAYVVDGTVRSATCVDGGIAIDLRSTQFSDEHAGETLREYTASGIMLRASILLPSTITDDRPATEDLGRPVPRDLRKLVLAHELVHALGYQHTSTKVVKGVVGQKSGELMNPNTMQTGWGFAGLP